MRRGALLDGGGGGGGGGGGVRLFERIMVSSFLCKKKLLTKGETLQTLIRLLPLEQSDLGLHCLFKYTTVPELNSAN